jgi:hypothetical protein
MTLRNDSHSLPARLVALGLLALGLVACGLIPGAARSQPAAVSEVADVPPAEVAAPIVITAAGDIESAIAEYKRLLGGPDNGGAPGPHTGGFRTINWDGVPHEMAAPNFMPPDFFNHSEAPRARGAFFSTPGQGVQVSAAAGNPSGTAERFGHINPQYADIFKTFSEERLFSPVGSNIADMTFFVPGTQIPAVTRGFGAVYTDIDTNHTAFEYFDAAGNSLGEFEAPIAAGGLSFLGVVFPEPVVFRVRVVYGTAALGPDNSETYDVAVMDDFVYGEPHALATAFTGPVTGSDAFIGLVVNGANVMAYVCDSRTVSEWFSGQLQAGQLELLSRGGARLSGTVTGNSVIGSFTAADSAPLAYVAQTAVLPAGLYRAEAEAGGDKYVGGWIVLADGRQQGLITRIQDGTSNTAAGIDFTRAISVPMFFSAGHTGGINFGQSDAQQFEGMEAQPVSAILPFVEQ